MKDFFMSWLIGTAFALIVMVIVSFIGVMIWVIVSELGVWAWLIVIPIFGGLMLAVSEL